MSSTFFIKTFDHILLPGILALVLLLAMILPQAALSQENQAGEQNTLRQASQQWMQVGIKQYQSNQFADAERSFRRARVFQNYLTAAERQELNELLKNTRIAISEGKQTAAVTVPAEEPAEPNQAVKVEAVVEELEQKIKESESSKEEGVEKIEEALEAVAVQPAEIETESEAAVPAIETELTESERFYTTIIAQLEQELEVQSLQMADAEETIQAQAQALREVEERLKAETQALTEAHQQAQIQAQQSDQAESEIRSRIEAEYAEAVSAAEAEAQKQAELRASAIKALEQKLEAQEEEISKAKAKAESESAARLEAQKTAEQEAKARVEIEERLSAVTTELSRQKEQAARAVEPDVSKIQEVAEPSDEVIVIRDKSLRARFLGFTDWLSHNRSILVVAGLLFLAVLVVISKLHGASKISSAYASHVPESSSYIGVKLSGGKKSKQAVKDSGNKHLTFTAEQDPKQKSSEQPIEHWMRDWKERHASKISNRDKPSRIRKKWPQEKDKS
jgi:chemotaxis protein histidine kinase CheA